MENTKHTGTVTEYYAAGAPLDIVCGCYINGIDRKRWIVFCPLHKSAPAMLAALEESVEIRGPMTAARYERSVKRIRAAIRQAKGDAI